MPSIVQMPPQEPFYSLTRPAEAIANEVNCKLDSLQKSQQAKCGTGQAVAEQHQQQKLMPSCAVAAITPDPPPDSSLPIMPPSFVRNGFLEHVPPPPMPWGANTIVGNSYLLHPSISLGSVGHPNSCGKPCKYAREKRGCTDGLQCSDCRQSQRHWPGAGPPMQSAAGAPNSQGVRLAELTVSVKAFRADECDAPSVPSSFPSVGSIGHPLSCCGVGCKFKGKARGCKDGEFCVRCHLCPWRRSQPTPQQFQRCS